MRRELGKEEEKKHLQHSQEKLFAQRKNLRCGETANKQEAFATLMIVLKVSTNDHDSLLILIRHSKNHEIRLQRSSKSWK